MNADCRCVTTWAEGHEQPHPMTQTRIRGFFALGVILMCLPGLFTGGMRLASAAFMVVGYAILIVATVKNGGSKPGTALVLLATSNLSFWLSYGLWLIRLKFAGPSPREGIETFAGPLAFWVILLSTFVVYESVVFLRSVVINRERTAALTGLAAVIVQVFVTLRLAYDMVQSV